VKFARVQVPELREAVSRILDDLSYRRAAGHIAESFRAAGGAVAAAGALEQLVRDHRREPATKARRSR
jgi:UDP:flavonoid glycosyltransferase YjiC (YdhE family)